MRPNRRHGLSVRHIGRYGEIVSVLVKHGFGDLLSKISLERHIGKLIKPSARKNAGAHRLLTRWDRVRMALEELGPTFVKLGQFMSNRPDMLPRPLVENLEKLQDSVAPFPFDEARALVESAFGAPLDSVCCEFMTEPVAAASIGQVYKARLRSGEQVAVKVMRPAVEQTVRTDIEILYHLASLFDPVFQETWGLSLLQVCAEFERAIYKELDFAIEAANIEHFQRIFAGDPEVHIPAVYRQWSGRRVLITEYIHGVKVGDAAALDERGFDRKTIAARGARAILKQVFIHGFFHADPHPGNILIMPGNVICFLDLGMTGVLSQTHRGHLGDMILGVAARDTRRIVRALSCLSKTPVQNTAEMEYDITELLEDYSFLQLKDVNVGEVLDRVLRLVAHHRLSVIPGFYLLLKAMITIEGVGGRLDPQFSMMEHVEPFARRMISDRMRPDRLLADLAHTAGDLAGIVRDIPIELRDIFDLVRAGKIHIEFEHRGLEPMLVKHDQLVTRIVYALVLSSLLIGSSLIVHSGVPPVVFGIPLIGLAGFLATGVMGFGLLISILRNRRM